MNQTGRGTSSLLAPLHKGGIFSVFSLLLFVIQRSNVPVFFPPPGAPQKCEIKEKSNLRARRCTASIRDNPNLAALAPLPSLHQQQVSFLTFPPRRCLPRRRLSSGFLPAARLAARGHLKCRRLIPPESLITSLI